MKSKLKEWTSCALKKPKSRKFFVVLFVLLALVGTLSEYVLSSSSNSLPTSTDNDTFANRGQIAKVVYADSGSANDIQAAVNILNSSGGIVYVPAGTYNWSGETVNIPTGVNVIGASFAGCQGHEDNWTSYSATTILHNNDVPICRSHC